ncbi:MAG: general secretion pathway protein GspM [Gammaproteobacteria bacterium HGW-Gammaproteobacteria-7]|nr:MAG: general secretion pathway protein GspM [Gammaproteobacteria bacterium HGW-Gammaproteobacteria-7]
MFGLLLLLIYSLTVHWWWTRPQLQLRSQLIELRDQELRLRMTIEQRDEISRRVAQLQAAEADNPGFLPEASAELATAALVGRLESVVENASPSSDSCQLTQRTPARTRTNERFRRVQIEVRLRCGNQELAAILHALESERPTLFVDNLSILMRRGRGVNASSAGALDVSFALYGYLRHRGDDDA